MFKFNPGNTIHMMTFRTESLILQDHFQNKTLNTYVFNDKSPKYSRRVDSSQYGHWFSFKISAFFSMTE